MSLENFAIMRHELLLTAAFLIILIGEIFTAEEKKGKLRGLAVILFAVVTAGGLPSRN